MNVREVGAAQRAIRGGGLLVLALAAAACSLVPPSRGTDNGLPGGSRAPEFLLMRPRAYEPERVYPLIVALHGYGGDAAGLSRAFESLAGLPVLVALPQGEFPHSWGGFSWFLMTEDRGLWPRSDERSVGRVLRCIQAVRSRERVGSVVVFGFSQGASLAYLTGLRNPGLVDGIAAVAGNLPPLGGEGAVLDPDQVIRAKRVAVFIARGTEDPYVVRERFIGQRDFFAGRGYRVETLEFEGAHELTLPLLTRLWRWIELSVRARE